MKAFSIVALLGVFVVCMMMFSSGSINDITAKIISFEDYARPCAGDSCGRKGAAQNVHLGNISSIPDQSTPILDLGIPGLSITDRLSVMDITGQSPAGVFNSKFIPPTWVLLVIILICLTGAGSAIAYFVESHKKPQKVEEKKELPSRGEELKLIQLLERARKAVFEDMQEAERLYFEINELYKELPADIQDKYYDKIMLLYDKIILQIKKMQVQKELSMKNTEKAGILMKEIEDLYSAVKEKEPERKIPELSSETKKDYELTINKIHDLIISAKQNLNQDVESAKQEIQQIVELLKQLPADIRAKFQYDLDNLKTLSKQNR